MAKRNQKLVAKAPTPLLSGYCPEIDVTRELDAADASSMLRNEHLKEIFQEFVYLKRYTNSKIVFEPTVPEIDMNSFQKQNWTYFVYCSPGVDLKEEVPPNMPEPLGLPFVMQFFVDADHAVKTVTRRSRSRYIIFLNSAPI